MPWSRLSYNIYFRYFCRAVHLYPHRFVGTVGHHDKSYPIEIKNSSPVVPMRLFNDVTNRYMNPMAGECIDISHFRSNWLYSHSFEAEATSQGWIGISLKLSEPFTESHTLVIWTVSRSSISIDKFHQVEKQIL